MARKPLDVAALKHGESRLNIPTAEFESVMREEEKSPVRVAYERRNRDLDPQLVWRGKDMADWSDLIVQAPPLYIQEKVHPKALIDDLRRETARRRAETAPETPDLFGDFNGLPDREARTEFYAHAAHWSNRMICGDSLSVMASLAEREGLRGQVQCIYLDPPYGIRFNSNFQWSTTSRDVKDGDRGHVTREPEQVRAFRDTWRDGVHSYLTYLRDRLTVARDLLSESGSIFVQIGDENVHRVRALMDEVFGEDNFCSFITVAKTTGAGSPAIGTNVLASINDYVLWYAKSLTKIKYRQQYTERAFGEGGSTQYTLIESEDAATVRSMRADERSQPDSIPDGWRIMAHDNLTSQTGVESTQVAIPWHGKQYTPGKGGWKTNQKGALRLTLAQRVLPIGNTLRYRRKFRDFAGIPINNTWTDFRTSGFSDTKVYVVQTNPGIIARCILMTTDPGDLVLDPTCGSGATAYVAEQWGRRWITIDTSRVAIALARSRLMGARYPWWLLADSPEGRLKEAELSRTPPKSGPTGGDLRLGFVYDRVPHVTLKSIANNAEIDVIWERLQPAVEEALRELNRAMEDFPCRHPVEVGGRKGASIDFVRRPEVTLPSGGVIDGGNFMEWEVPRKAETPMDGDVLIQWKQAVSRKHRLESMTKMTKHERHSEEAIERSRFELAERIEALNDAIEDPHHIHVGRRRAHHYFTESDLEAHVAPDGTPMLPWSKAASDALDRFWTARIARQREIDASIAAKAEFEFLYDKPHPDKTRVRVAGPFTVESLSPHRTLAVDWNDELIDPDAKPRAGTAGDFAQMILENLRAAGVQQAHKEDRIAFTALTGWPGEHICAEGLFMEGETPRRAGVFIGPEFGTVSRPDLVAAAREAGDAGFDLLIACAFSYDAHSAEFDRLGRVPVLKARMNPDLHMGGELKATGAGNLFVIFGEPDIRIEDLGDGMLRVKVFGVDVFKPQTGEVLSEGVDGIALWMLDDDYNEESFFVRHAYFLGANDPYKALKTTLKAEIDEEAWATLYSDTSRPFPRPASGRIAVKVINHLGDEVMKVFGV